MSRPASIGLVDDDPLVLRLLPPQLERHGVVVIWADTAEVALRRLEDHRPPGLDREGPDRGGHGPVVLLPGCAGRTEQPECPRSGRCRHVGRQGWCHPSPAADARASE